MSGWHSERIARREFAKSDPSTVAWSVAGAWSLAVGQDLYAEVAGSRLIVPAGRPVTLPGSPVAGTDYAIWLGADGSLQASANFLVPPMPGARKVGGFHYAPGGNAPIYQKAAVTAGTALPAQTVPADQWALYSFEIDSAGGITVTPAADNTTGYATEAAAVAALPTRANNATTAWMGYITVKTKAATPWIAGTDGLAGGTSGNVASTTNYYSQLAVLSCGSTDKNVASGAFGYGLGGNTTPAINPYSCWDLNFRPACPDPRGMTLVADSFWCDIYLLGVDHLINGSSRYNVLIADGATPPKRSTKFDGDGVQPYPDASWHNLGEALRHHGKRHPTYAEAKAAFYGTTESASRGTDPVNTVLDPPFTSKWGVIQSTGVVRTFGSNFGGGVIPGWVFNTGGRGGVYQVENVVALSGHYNDRAYAGSGCSVWNTTLSLSNASYAARGVCDHLRIG